MSSLREPRATRTLVGGQGAVGVDLALESHDLGDRRRSGIRTALRVLGERGGASANHSLGGGERRHLRTLPRLVAAVGPLLVSRPETGLVTYWRDVSHSARLIVQL